MIWEVISFLFNWFKKFGFTSLCWRKKPAWFVLLKSTNYYCSKASIDFCRTLYMRAHYSGAYILNLITVLIDSAKSMWLYISFLAVLLLQTQQKAVLQFIDLGGRCMGMTSWLPLLVGAIAVLMCDYNKNKNLFAGGFRKVSKSF